MNPVEFIASLCGRLSSCNRKQSESKYNVRSDKVFGIGLPKTGTKTLGKCFQILGYKHCSYQPQLTYELMEGNLEGLYELADKYESFEDHPWMWYYDELALRYPNARFILTTRKNGAEWLDSAIHHDQRQTHADAEAGRCVFEHYFPGVTETSLYETHRNRVLRSFSNNPERLLEVCWDLAPSWETLCRFLGKPVPMIPFPHENKRPDKTINKVY